jgi:hypoxanthine-DNA glycosylase
MPTSFSPLVNDDASRIVLGSIPGDASLRQQQYYAHPQNTFWRIAASYLGFSVDQPYMQKVDKLLAAGIGLWDVVASCQRSGSLDSAIINDSVVANNFNALLSSNKNIKAIYFNGRKAEQLFARHCSEQIAGLVQQPSFFVLPSTSPAYAAMPFAEKLRLWQPVYTG